MAKTSGPPASFWTDFGSTGNDPAFSQPPGAWDVVYVGSSSLVQMPGICKIKVHHKKHKADKKSPSGTDGSTPTFLGWQPARFDIMVKLWTVDQLSRFLQMLPSFSGSWKSVPIQKTLPPLPEIGDPQNQQKLAAYLAAANAPPPTARIFKPLDISHPELSILGVNAFWMEQFLPFEVLNEQDPDQRVGVMQCWEYNKTKQTTINTPKGARGDISQLPTALKLTPPTASNPKTDPSQTEAVPLPAGGASGSF